MSDIITEWTIRYSENGMTLVPIVVETREPKIKYGQYKDTPQEISEVRTMLDKGLFNDGKFNGLALMTGKCTRGKFRGLWVCCVDIDGKEIFDKLLQMYSLEQLSKDGIFVEQHSDGKHKAHLWIWSEKPFPSLKLEGIEVKTNGMLCNIFPCHHRSGNRYMPVGDSLKIFQDGVGPVLHDNFIHVINKLSDGNYLDVNKVYNPLVRNKAKIPNGSRHNELISYANSIIARLHETTNKETIWEMFKVYNNTECVEPLGSKAGPDQQKELKELRQIFEDSWNNIVTNNQQYTEQNGELEKQEKEILSVSQALRSNSGNFKVKGAITARRPLFKMISSFESICNNGHVDKTVLVKPVFSVSRPSKCSQCNEKNPSIINIGYYNAVKIELQDLETFNDLERLQVLTFNKDTENIAVGENVVIDGSMQIDESKGKTLFPCFYAKSIRYDKNTKVVLTSQDIDAIHRFANFAKKDGSKINIIPELIKMVAPSVIGHDDVKKGLLFSAVNSASDVISPNFDYTRQTTHSCLIGEKGLAKSKLLRAATRMLYNSRYESAQSSSVLSLTAMVSKEDENYTLRLGPVPLAKNTICAINEFGRINFEDQSHFLDIMEEGWFTINKYGIHAAINSPTTIIVSANPTGNSDWNDDNKIDLDEIPALKPVLDRFDLLFVFRREKDEKKIRELAYKRGELEATKIPDYSYFLTRYLEYAKRLNPKIDDDARTMLNEFYIKTQVRGFGSNRVQDSLYRISKAIARLKLKEIVEVEDAEEAMQFYNEMLKNFELNVTVSANPKKLTYDKFIEILQNQKNNVRLHIGLTIQELHRIACEEDDQIASYLGPDYSTRTNKKLRVIVTMLENNSNIKPVGINPRILKWSDGLSDLSDQCDPEKELSEKNKVLVKTVIPNTNVENKIIPQVDTGSQRSHRSHRNGMCVFHGEIFGDMIAL